MNLYHAMARGLHSPSHSRSGGSRVPLAIVGAFIAIVLGGAAFFFWDRPDSIDTATTVATPPASLPAVASLPPAPAISDEQRSIEQNRKANVKGTLMEEHQSEPAAEEQAAFAERMRRVAEELKRAALKAAGINRPVPLDQDDYIPMPGGGVWVKVHDNDASGLDVWINHERWREVPKEEGITRSGTDETLIYSNGSASLFYVSQMSAGLNHCLLRVREN